MYFKNYFIKYNNYYGSFKIFDNFFKIIFFLLLLKMNLFRKKFSILETENLIGKN